MPSLREIKDHIASVRSTLKITSAMKLVASAKLRKAQQAAEGIRPYTEALAAMVAAVANHPTARSRWAGRSTPKIDEFSGAPDSNPQGASHPGIASPKAGAATATATATATAGRSDSLYIPEGGQKVAVVAVASNSSLCGAFNINVIRRTQELISGLRAEGNEVEVFSVGRKMADAMRKAGCPSPADYSALVGHSSFDKSAALAQTLIDGYNAGRYSRILLVYNHFVTTSSQKTVVKTYLPFEEIPSQSVIPSEAKDPQYILEPSRQEILSTLLPQVLRLRIHAVMLDSIAAEHAARTIAMQTASDNAEDLLDELTLEYNKGRQQKITAEILDIVGGSQQ